MQNKILIICGPTATGKTKLALRLAKKFNGDLISADSRQVYKGMDIVTGKDLPVNSKFKISNLKLDNKKLGYWETENAIRIWLTDLVNPQENFSVSLWNKFAIQVIPYVQSLDRLPIIVGVNGLYLRSLTRGIGTINIPINQDLRDDLYKSSVDELFEVLQSLDIIKTTNMNFSDRKNPRRLVRAIEVATWRLKNKEQENQKTKRDILLIGLNASREYLYKKIEARVDERIKFGAVKEVQKLVTEVPANAQSMDTSGYRALRMFIEGKIALDEAILFWKQREKRDLRRQFTQLKLEPGVNWFDVESPDWAEKVEKVVENWYNSI